MKAVLRSLVTLLMLFLALGASAAAHASPEIEPNRVAADGYFWVHNGADNYWCNFYNNAPTLSGCTNKNDEVFNNGYPCSGCDWIRLYWGSYYTGAYFCISPGAWYTQWDNPGLTFNRGSGLAGFGQSIWYNSASAKWSGPC